MSDGPSAVDPQAPVPAGGATPVRGEREGRVGWRRRLPLALVEVAVTWIRVAAVLALLVPLLLAALLLFR